MSQHQDASTQRAAVRDALTQVERLKKRTHRSGRAQYIAAQRAQRQHYWLGVPAVILSAVVGTTVFSGLSSSRSNAINIGVGVVAIVASVLTALQTFFRFAERAEKHRTAGADYAALKRQLDIAELTIRTATAVDATHLKQIADLVTAFNELDKAALNVPDWMYDRARHEQENDSEGI